MASKFRVGDSVYVPCSRFKELSEYSTSLYRAEVLQNYKRKIKVLLPSGESDWIGAVACHKDVGILIICLGDLATEEHLLDKLTKSVTQFCRLLVPDDQVLSFKVRSLAELVKVYERHQATHSHVIWIGHGGKKGFEFLVDGAVSSKELSEALKVPSAPKKTYVSLVCKSGLQSVASDMSKAAMCTSFIGPSGSVEAATASQFVQTFLFRHFIKGESVGASFNYAKTTVVGSNTFSLWNAGKKKTLPQPRKKKPKPCHKCGELPQ